MTTVTTSIIFNQNGKTQVLAKGAGKQRTVAYDHSVSHDANHGSAAGTLAKVLGLPADVQILHDVKPGGQHIFVWE